jgi:hypothetical protein
MKVEQAFCNLFAFAWSLAFALATVGHADNLSVVTLKLATGTLTSYDSETTKEYRSLLTWKSETNAQEVIVSDTHGPVGMNPHLTLEAGFATADGIAVLRGNAGGHLEYLRFAILRGSWNLHSKALIGSPSPDWRGVTFHSLTEFAVKKENYQPDKFEVSDQERSEHPMYRTVFKNGKVFVPEGSWIGTEVNDPAPKLAAKVGASVPHAVAPSQGVKDVAPIEHLLKTTQTKPMSSNQSSPTSYSIIVVLIVVAIGLLWLLIKRP